MPDSRDIFELEEVCRQVFQRIKTGWNSFEENGFSASQGFILEKLEREGPLKVSQVADALCFTAGAITALADKLISAGYTERKRSEEDRRVVYLEITPQGREMLTRIREHRKQVIEGFFSSVSHEDSQHLIRIFRSILNNEDKRE
ncbi:MarR family winged helix-turn-helix transcriptional regulator [Paenibacillus thalictri]|uniref:MarR family transcriptional regulator n=1 Tax=Paenibacillus thalictri TaxID=2527873 RepID=A0A4Q9DZX0_9BACL|nr:MarR family transcriptional regulator [Paenibacillus thalictri]TBL81710.1 MarR family transcriptional regulator [Paenibacillus thalictri]